MQGSGTNHNMNHIVKRIETRVLAPPGGFSSISFGGAEAPSYKDHDFNGKSRAIKEAASPPVKAAPATKVAPVASTTQKENETNATTTRVNYGRRGQGAGKSSFTIGWD
jgi:hypothetical protein